MTGHEPHQVSLINEEYFRNLPIFSPTEIIYNFEFKFNFLQEYQIVSRFLKSSATIVKYNFF